MKYAIQTRRLDSDWVTIDTTYYKDYANSIARKLALMLGVFTRVIKENNN